MAAGGIFLADWLIITETKRVQAGIYGLAKAFQAGNVDECLDFFSPQDQTDRELVGGPPEWCKSKVPSASATCRST